MATKKVVVHERAIQSMFAPGGQVNRFGTRVATDITRGARSFALRRARTGELARSFSTRSRMGHNSVSFTCYSTAPHARHLEYGTRAQTGVLLYKGLTAPDPAAGRWQDFIGARMRRVEGTPRTRFMSRALDKALAKHGLA